MVSLHNSKDTTVFVSWNDDTETVKWSFYAATKDQGSRQLLGEVKRDGFETSLKIDGQHVKAVVADAADSRGRVFVSTQIAVTEKDVIADGVNRFEEESSKLQILFDRLELV